MSGKQPDPCAQCGHDTNDHRLYGYHAENEAPVEGWMSCPVPGCECHQTWSRDGGSPEGAAAAYERFLSEQRERGPAS
jgi:hypothetical protein